MIAEDLAFLEMSDVKLLNLPTLAASVMTRCIKLGMCKPPLVFDFAAELENPRKPIQVLSTSIVLALGLRYGFLTLLVNVCCDAHCLFIAVIFHLNKKRFHVVFVCFFTCCLTCRHQHIRQ